MCGGEEQEGSGQGLGKLPPGNSVARCSLCGDKLEPVVKATRGG